jgi:hypothetical protein
MDWQNESTATHLVKCVSPSAPWQKHTSTHLHISGQLGRCIAGQTEQTRTRSNTIVGRCVRFTSTIVLLVIVHFHVFNFCEYFDVFTLGLNCKYFKRNLSRPECALGQCTVFVSRTQKARWCGTMTLIRVQSGANTGVNTLLATAALGHLRAQLTILSRNAIRSR